MSSRSSKRRRKPVSSGKKIIMPSDNTLASDELDGRLPTSTMATPNHDFRETYNKNATIAPEIGEQEESHEPYAQTYPALIDKHLLSRKSINIIFIVGILCVSGFIFIQDNEANKLNGWSDIWWSIQKCSPFVLVFIFNLLCQLVAWLFKKK